MAAQPAGLQEHTFKTFGETGRVYQVVGPAARGKKGEMVAIQVIGSGETLDYPAADMLLDPVAR